MNNKYYERTCGECGKPYILTKEERALIKGGWYLLRYICPNCASRKVNRRRKND
jgi:endogenous inhibitor of DNA gyrase (YacG/DUF329 family)